MRIITALAGVLALGVTVPALAQQHGHDGDRGNDHGIGRGSNDRGGDRRGPPAPPQMRGERPRPAPGPQNAPRTQPRPAPAPAPAGPMRGSPPPAPPPARPGPQQHPAPPPAAVNRPAPAPRYSPPARPAAESRAWNQQGGWRQGAWQRHDNWEQHRSPNWNDDHRGWGQRGGYGGYYIPAPRFTRSFGPGHFFRLHARPVIYDGYPRFYYGGYHFLMVDPWPAYWGDSWYDSDDLFISYDGDGYYLHNRRYPDIALAVVVTL